MVNAFRIVREVMYMEIGLGVIGFLLMYVSDFNQIIWRLKVFKPLFSVGILALIVSTGMMISQYFVNDLKISETVIILIIFLLSLGLLVYILFFAIPFDDSYISQFNERSAYKKRIYALTRHPGIIPFTVIYLLIAYVLKTEITTIFCLLMIGMNVVYVYIQDSFIFPRLFTDYQEYKKTTPFLIPNIKSMKRMLKTFKKGAV